MYQTKYMKRYFYFLPFILFFTSCEKLSHENKVSKALYGTWRITDIKISAGNTLYKAYYFKNEKFNFKEDNKLELTSAANNTYTGNWFVTEGQQQTDCYTTPEGNTECHDTKIPILTADTWIPSTNEIKPTDFEELKFISDNSFVTTISPDLVTTYQYYFTKEQ